MKMTDLKFAINGFGRIGKSILKAYAYENIPSVSCAVINIGAGDINNHLHLLQYDSVHGFFNKFKVIDAETLEINKSIIKIIAEPNPSKIEWNKFNVSLVMECSGKLTNREAASIHLNQGANTVLVSAPVELADATIVYGVNDETLNLTNHKIISAGSCTTNCLAPLAQKLNDELGIVSGFMTTVHAYTKDQNLVDSSHKDKRRGRAANLSIIPTSTGAAKSIDLVLPELTGKLDGIALRVPTPNVSLIDLTFTTERVTNVNDINAMMKIASQEYKDDIFAYCDQELVSIDYNRNKASLIFDASQTKVVKNNFCRVAAWYDNEWGFSNRMLDIAKIINKKK